MSVGVVLGCYEFMREKLAPAKVTEPKIASKSTGWARKPVINGADTRREEVKYRYPYPSRWIGPGEDFSLWMFDVLEF